MIKNIKLSADEDLIKKSREISQKEKPSLNDAFRDWIYYYVTRGTVTKNYEKIMEDLSYVNSGKKFSREEMNER